MQPKEKVRMFLSKKTKFDLFSMVIGFSKYCCNLLTMFPGASITARCMNQDRLENFFGEQRALNGQADNPTLMQTGVYSCRLCFDCIVWTHAVKPVSQ